MSTASNYGNYSYNGSMLGVDEHYFTVHVHAELWARLSQRRFFPEAQGLSAGRAVLLGALRRPKPHRMHGEIQGESFTVIALFPGRRAQRWRSKRLGLLPLADTPAGLSLCRSPSAVLFRFDEPQTAALRADSTDNMTTVGQKARSCSPSVS
jgi:hypothetical protein